MKTKVGKWGNSLAVRIPKSVVQQLELKDDMVVEVSSSDGSVMIKPLRNKDAELKRLLKGITPGNYYGEVDWGPDVGNEIVVWED